MKKKYLILGSLACMQLCARAQAINDSIKTRLNKTEIELVFNHYIQDGNNSAVTGGIGTEKLTVFGPALNLKNTSGKNTYSLNVGSDIITSASTDNIDFVLSSASKVDARNYIHADYSRDIDKQNLNINGGLGFSMESDYLSLSANVGFTKADKKNMRTYSGQFQYYNDDLRYGRLNSDYYKPVELVYPIELRNREWFDIYRRKSYNFKLGFTQILNKRNILGIFPEMSYQKGLLSTTFHRIYFTDNTVVVENLPNERYKGSLAVKLNSFVGGNIILKNTINAYSDNFGINALAFENEIAIKLKPFLTLMPGFRIYSQKASKYFAGYLEHQSDEKFYTSDYDLSSFQTYNIGIGINHNPQKYLSNRIQFNAFIIRYNFLYRTNNLKAHIISLLFQWTKYGKKQLALTKIINENSFL